MNTIKSVSFSHDLNGNKTVKVSPAFGRAFSIQTNGNLPRSHRAGLSGFDAECIAEVIAYVTEHGTDTQRAALGLPAYCPKVFVQRRGESQLETVDEFYTRKEARAMLEEYRMSDPTATFYLSSRACKDWRK